MLTCTLLPWCLRLALLLTGLLVASGAILDQSLIAMGGLIDRSIADLRFAAPRPQLLQRIPLATFIADACASAAPRPAPQMGLARVAGAAVY